MMSAMDNDYLELIDSLTTFIRNERTRCYNEGLDAERKRCSAIAMSYCSPFEVEYTEDAMTLRGRQVAQAIEKAISDQDGF